jgi:hypothetical protein
MKALHFLNALILLSTTSCKEDLQETIPVDFEFRLLSEQGINATTFDYGQNFVFSFHIINKSSKSIVFQSMETDDFLKVLRMNNTEGDPIIEIGKPYENIFCTYQNGYPISSKDTLKIEIPWTPSPWEPGSPFYSAIFCGVIENSPLIQGQYKTRFESDFIFSKDGIEYRTQRKEFEITFNIL